MRELEDGQVRELICEDGKLGWSAWRIERSSRGRDELFRGLGDKTILGVDRIEGELGPLGEYANFMIFHYVDPNTVFLSRNGMYFMSAMPRFDMTMSRAMFGRPPELTVEWQGNEDDPWFMAHDFLIRCRLVDELGPLLDEEMCACEIGMRGPVGLVGRDSIRMVESDDARTRRIAAMAMFQRGFAVRDDDVLRLASDPDVTVRRTVLRSISCMGRFKISSEAFRVMSSDPDWQVRAMVCHHLNAFGAGCMDGIDDCLAALADDPEYEVRIAFAMNTWVNFHRDEWPIISRLALSNTHDDDFMGELAVNLIS